MKSKTTPGLAYKTTKGKKNLVALALFFFQALVSFGPAGLIFFPTFLFSFSFRKKKKTKEKVGKIRSGPGPVLSAVEMKRRAQRCKWKEEKGNEI